MTQVAVTLGALLTLAVLTQVVRTRAHPVLDPQRAFTQQQRLAVFARAGNQCEHKALFGRRCTTQAAQCDHIYPWSRGGATAMSNGQALCGPHNNRKSAWVPTRFYIWRLERRRCSYFPAGEDVKVRWTNQPG